MLFTINDLGFSIAGLLLEGWLAFAVDFAHYVLAAYPADLAFPLIGQQQSYL